MSIVSVSLRCAEAASGHCSRVRSFAAVILLATSFVGCATRNPPPTFGYDHSASFSGLSTYSWLNQSAKRAPRGDSIVDGLFIDRTVREAVSGSLERKGLRVSTDEQPDIYVDYDFVDAGALSKDN